MTGLPTRSGRVVVGIATACSAVPAAYLAVLTAVGFRQPRSSLTAPAPAPATRFVILVPAHNEALGIDETLASFDRLTYPSELYTVHVVADNCTDHTAAVVRHLGAEAHERTDLAEPGKGPALNWLHDRLAASGTEYDALVIVDADTSLAPDFLDAMDRALSGGAEVAQGYYSVRDPDDSPSASFRFAALACRHHLRALGRNRLGASCGLYGNGMVFRRGVLDRYRWSGHLVEDAELQNELLLDGIVVRYVPDAALWAEMPDDEERATSQNERWERGRLELAQRFVPRLLRRALRMRERRIALLDAAVDHVVPPLSVLATLHAALGLGAAFGTLTGSPSARRVLGVQTMAIAVIAGHTVAGLIAVGAPAHRLRALLSAPRIVLWKARLWVSVARPDAEVEWTRTRRNADAPDTATTGVAS